MFFLINTTIILFPLFIISGFYIHFVSQLHTSPRKHAHCPTAAHIAPHLSDPRDPLPIAAHDFVFKASDDCNYASINVIRPTDREADCNSSRKNNFVSYFAICNVFNIATELQFMHSAVGSPHSKTSSGTSAFSEKKRGVCSQRSENIAAQVARIACRQ